MGLNNGKKSSKKITFYLEYSLIMEGFRMTEHEDTNAPKKYKVGVEAAWK
ncbi:hypothetical protein SAMN06272722_10846 [Paenibacillus sp. RU5A]|nr:hypothetical protein SAMN06272722_10846 [Paenibacillus sp. RU5A]SOC72843.1 hypothetical protein SAMN05880581_10846 [Paenibacillus sp. RU26A]SOC75098.1 hypothetical protein SAMN05880586_10846 [Paenibacillus sp. RU5M]